MPTSRDQLLHKAGIAELRDGLTLELLRDNPNTGWIVKSCRTKDAVIGVQKIKGIETIIWYDGSFLDGTWRGGIWHSGQWMNGTWKSGEWKDGTWHKGEWKDGTWYNGDWKSGTWTNGTWLAGNWLSGSWYGGNFGTAKWRYSTCIWKNGTWYNGVFRGGIWSDGDWQNGTWNDGTWKKGSWRNGTWKSGEWDKGDWYRGDWLTGEWYGGTWYDGKWRDGKWADGSWKSGVWFDGTWKDGTWENGKWHNGLWLKGSWRGGHWFKGIWKEGSWRAGTWYDGTWHSGTWGSGTWKSGTWMTGMIFDPTTQRYIDSNKPPKVVEKEEKQQHDNPSPNESGVYMPQHPQQDSTLEENNISKQGETSQMHNLTLQEILQDSSSSVYLPMLLGSLRSFRKVYIAVKDQVESKTEKAIWGIMQTFCATLGITGAVFQEAIVYNMHSKHPDLFEKGILPSRWEAAKKYLNKKRQTAVIIPELKECVDEFLVRVSGKGKPAIKVTYDETVAGYTAQAYTIATGTSTITLYLPSIVLMYRVAKKHNVSFKVMLMGILMHEYGHIAKISSTPYDALGYKLLKSVVPYIISEFIKKLAVDAFIKKLKKRLNTLDDKQKQRILIITFAALIAYSIAQILIVARVNRNVEYEANSYLNAEEKKAMAIYFKEGVAKKQKVTPIDQGKLHKILKELLTLFNKYPNSTQFIKDLTKES